jgi:hypothetical protein
MKKNNNMKKGLLGGDRVRYGTSWDTLIMPIGFILTIIIIIISAIV